MRRATICTIIPSDMKGELGVYRFDREIPYASATYELDWPSEWETKDPRVSQSALKLGQQLIPEFRYRRKVHHDRRYWKFIRWERQARYSLGFFVLFMNIEVYMICRERLRDLYLEVPPEWAERETCYGFLVPFSLVLSYHMSGLKEPGVSGLLRVVYTEYVATSAAMWLWEVYDTHRVWWLSPKMRQVMDELVLSRVLGRETNEQEIRELLKISAELDWDDPEICPPENQKYNVNTMRYSVCHGYQSCGDWLWFDPREKVTVAVEEAAHLRKTSLQFRAGIR